MKLTLFSKLLITTVLMMGANAAWAQASYNHSYTVSDGVTIDAAAGQGYGYFLYNVGAGKFLTGGRGWGSFATADHAGKIVEFIASSTNYKIHNKHVSANSVSSFEGYLPASLWADNNNETEANQTWTFAKVGDENKYTIYSTAQSKYLYYGTNTELALGETANSDYYYWIIVPKTVRDAAGDYTYYIQNQGFNRPWEKPVWNGIGDDSNSANLNPAFPIFAMNWDATNPCAEKYHAVFNLYQQISETVPNGKYKVYAQAFYRQDDAGTGPAPTLYANSDNQNLAVLNANSEGTTETMDGASAAFTAGQYVNQVTTVVVNGSLKVGIDITQADQWVIWDNFVIDYLGTCLVNDAIALNYGGTVTADTWYSYQAHSAGTYAVSASSALSTFVYTKDGNILTSEAASTVTTSLPSSITLTEGEIIYFKSTTSQTLNIGLNSESISSYIASHNGDLTSLINGTFEIADGWTGGAHWNADWATYNWRGATQNGYYEINSGNNGTMSFTLHNMPAGTYKVVAASHAGIISETTTITPSIAGTNGTAMKAQGCRYVAGNSEINTNGVQMPNSSLGGFTTDTSVGRNWQWITATGTLASEGDLVISFTVAGNKDNAWFSIDDVHLYCTQLGASSYTRTVGDGGETINTSNSVVTADIILDNPNTVLRTTGKITTAAGQEMNNDQYSSSRITKLVLYDGYQFTKLTDEVGSDNGAILYRNIPADTWCTLTLPFWPTTSLTKKYPSSYADGTLTFSDVVKDSWGGVDKPMLVKSATELTAIEGKLASTNGGGSGVNHNDMTSGSGIPMTGVYASGTVTQSDASNYYYVVGSDNNLHKVTGTGVTIAPFRAYFTLTNAQTAPSLISLNFDGATTGISASLNSNEEIMNNKVFNLNGQRVAQPKKGLYIVNGKKVVIK